MNKIKHFFGGIGQTLRTKQGEIRDLRVYQRIRHKKRLLALSILALVLLIGVLVLYFRVETSFGVVSGEGWKDVNGTIYEPFGKNLLKYSPDGVSCITAKGAVKWSATYSMQTPLADICGTTAAIAEQQGTQVCIFNEDGLAGQFETTLPITKVKVARQGVVSVAQEDGDVTWINFYEKNGTEIAANRTTINQSGYPMDVALSSDGLKMMVSYLLATEGNMSTKIAFYNFDSVGQAELNNLVSSAVYENVVVPQVYFADNNTAVAIHSDGFSVYRGSQIPEVKVHKTFTEEILSTFHDDTYIGFVFASDRENYKYRLQLYNLNGKMVMQRYLDQDYTGIRIQDGNVILYNEKMFEVFTAGGRKKVSVTYNKPILDVVKTDSFRSYLVSSTESTELIRVR
ncbi:MAG: DUF5711 family protein [Candidatus Limivivens sp.]|nr:DUF5711 family protein [Candidatus Limivivens sp.]